MYRLPDFHLSVDVYRGTGFPALPSFMISSGISCQVRSLHTGYIIIKCPKGIRIPINGQDGVSDFTFFNVPSGSTEFYLCESYSPVAMGYPNQYEQYTAVYQNTNVWPPRGVP